MKLIISILVTLTAGSAFAQSKNDLKNQVRDLNSKIVQLEEINKKLTSDCENKDIFGSTFGTILNSNLVVFDGMYLPKKDFNPESISYKQRFLNLMKTDQAYRERVLETLGLNKNAEILAISLKDCRGNDRDGLDRASDVIRSVSCSAVIVIK